MSVLEFVGICLLGGTGRRVRWQDGWRGVRADGGGSVVDIGLGGLVYVDKVWVYVISVLGGVPDRYGLPCGFSWCR